MAPRLYPVCPVYVIKSYTIKRVFLSRMNGFGLDSRILFDKAVYPICD